MVPRFVGFQAVYRCLMVSCHCRANMSTMSSALLSASTLSGLSACSFFKASFLLSPSPRNLSRLAPASSHSSPLFIRLLPPTSSPARTPSLKAPMNRSRRLAFSANRSFARRINVSRYSGCTSLSRRSSTCRPIIDSSASPDDRTATSGVAEDMWSPVLCEELEVGRMFMAPLSRKPACSAQRRRSCAWDGDAVRM